MAENENKVVKAEEKKPEKPVEEKKEKKKGRIKEGWRGFKSETKKIVWPTWKQVLKNTGIVLVAILCCAVVIGALDYAFRIGIDALTKLFV